MEMPFGKHKGKSVETLPRRYLRWLQQNVELFGELKTAVEITLNGQTVPVEPELDDLIHHIVTNGGNHHSNNNKEKRERRICSIVSLG